MKKHTEVDETGEELTAPVPTRIRVADKKELQEMEKIGFKTATVIRECVRIGLPMVKAEIAAALSNKSKKP